MMTEGELARLGSSMAGLMFIWAMFKQYFPFDIEQYIDKYFRKFMSLFDPYIRISFQEFLPNQYERSQAFASIERYLGDKSTILAKRLRANMIRDSNSLVLSMDDFQEIRDEYKGVKLRWVSSKHITQSQTISFYPNEDDKRFYQLTFHQKDRDLVTNFYLDYVMKKGKEIVVKTRRRKLFTNNGSEQWSGNRKTLWSHVVFEHPSTFDTLAMQPNKKQEIIDDLISFSKSKDYYKKIGNFNFSLHLV